MADGGRFKQLNFCAVLVLLAMVGVLIAAAAIDWYGYSNTYDLEPLGTGASVVTGSIEVNKTELVYTLSGRTTNTEVNGIENNKFEEWDSSFSSTRDLFALIQAFVLIALILSFILLFIFVLLFADAVRNKILFMAGMTPLRFFYFAIVFVIIVSLVIAFMALVGITDAFSDDFPVCNMGPCKRFRDSNTASLGQQTVNGQDYLLERTESWGPKAGWFCVLAIIPLSILLAFIVVINKFPIPIDSMSTGEAL
eukprot:CAMPEP_0117045520 /NCGR_PEP_ID=MMETSP0472-20121206/31491_1 /TAXON_ID=693140 ORGANISM="Tiarina fusus, Strain LIS" /NCGR_SAMPLE_ID=MMETSP0472 /ASSEMBLY_ACC=CAM_ASM_000603 /LENGTH=251 /DNA_ID=CAMNT_0004757553 /DNA_START=15 /DNA_END=770 /DNA_ORIENTATION=+